MDFFIILSCQFVLINLCRSQCISSFGPTKHEFVLIEECSETGDHEIVFVPKISRDPRHCSVRKLCYSLSVSLQYDLNDDYETEALFFCQDNVGLWKPVGTPSPRVKACSDSSNWMDLMKTRTHAAVRCPIPKGNYSFECEETFYVYEMDKWIHKGDHNEQIMFYGQYKVVQTYYRNGRTVGCIIGVVHFKPSESTAIAP